MTGTPRKTALAPSQAVDPSFSLEDFSSFKKRLCSATIKCFTSSDSWFSPSLNRAYSNRILHSSTAPSGMLISGTGGSNFPATTAELCTAYCLFYCWGLWCLCVNCASARYR
jgi:hypothetical protein